MKKINEKREDYQGAVEKKDGKPGAGMSPGREGKDPALEGLRLGRRIFKKLKDVEDLIEIIAREIARQLDRAE